MNQYTITLNTRVPDNPDYHLPRKKIKIIVVDDHEMFREGLGILLSTVTEFELIGTAPNGRELKRLLKTTAPHVVLMDVKLPAEDGIELTEYVKEHYPEVQVLALSMNDDPSVILRMLSAGASGYVLKNASKNELKDAISTVLNGEEYYSPEAAFQVINKISRRQKDTVAGIELNGFSLREVQIVRLICEGKTNTEISDLLSLSVRTIEKHRFNIMKKMNVRTSAEMAIYAMKNNLLDI
jgi:DNA-binding NarL/FixJ family response regulator